MKKFLLAFAVLGTSLSFSWAEDAVLPLKTLSGHPGAVFSLAFSSDSQVLVSAGSPGTINLWDTKDFHSMRTWKDHSDSVRSIFYSPGGKFLISGGDDQTIIVRSAADYSVAERIPMVGKVGLLTQSANGKNLAAVLDEKTVRFLEEKTYSVVKSVDGNAAVFSPDLRTIAVAGPDFKIKILDRSNFGVAQALLGHKAPILALAFNANGTMLASASADRTVRLWDPRGYNQIKVIKTKDYAVSALAFSPDGRLLAYGGTVIKEDTPYRYNDTEFFVWDIIKGKQVASLEGHRGAILALAFSPNNKWLASGSADKTIQVWDTKSWTPKPKKAALSPEQKKKK